MSDKKPVLVTDQDFESTVLSHGTEGRGKKVFFWSATSAVSLEVLAEVHAAVRQWSRWTDWYLVNVDNSPETARRYGVADVPALLAWEYVSGPFSERQQKVYVGREQVQAALSHWIFCQQGHI